jgi:hypothetical protein
VVRRLVTAWLVFVTSIATASAGVEIRATCALELARDPVHVRTLRSEVVRALGSAPVTARYTLDVSLVRLTATIVDRQLEVRAEVRALLSDASGIRWHTTARATARGNVRDRALLQRDAITAAARDLAKAVRRRARV